MKIYTLILAITVVLINSVSLAQSPEKCGTQHILEFYESQTPGYKQAVDETYKAIINRAKNITRAADELYRIPLVIHVVYNENKLEQNLHDSVILNQISILNADFQRLNADTINMRSIFAPIAGAPMIKFELASTDPNGNSTTGITRTETTEDGFLDILSGNIAEGVKSTATGGIDPWDQSQFLNIWICDMSFFGSPFVLGYATPPANLPNWPNGGTSNLGDGVVIQFNFFGSNNPNSDPAFDVQGRTVTHEVGHYLGLRHIWGDGDCTEDDLLADTPNAESESSQDCDTTKNTCVDTIPGGLGDLPDMIENYMDYSAESCQNSFTNGQGEIIRSVLENERIDLLTSIGLSPLAIPETKYNKSTTIYPNPNSGKFIVKTTDANSIQILNSIGQVVKMVPFNSDNTPINLDEKGIYFIQICSGENTVTKKLVVK
ncbi:MAG: T9SS type A sorting domain-containing protein [Flavobacteriales bacterium]|jgi:hypothetical protein|nr:T9SS type A sorting domain-containing protein [Flavobacteriales bacterium]